MAKYQITYSCSHTETKDLFGPEEQRRRYRTWAETQGTCEACRKADKALTCEAIEIAHELQALTGTEKQIAWARSLRADKVAEIERHLETMQIRIPADKIEAFEVQCARIWQAIAEKTGSSWWIDHRTDVAAALLSALYKEQAR